MKKLLILLITLFSLAAFVGCNESKYEPVESTEEEARVVMTLEIEGEEYEVRYELYRMLFLNNKASVDGGDSGVWSGPNAADSIAKINEIILNRAAEIYSVLHLADTLGIDPYSDEIDDEIAEYVRISVEGNGSDISGHGSYEEYLASLAERGMNYSVQELIFRYSIVYSKITEYYAGTEDQALGNIPGEFEVTRDNVKAYYDSDSCVRLLQLYFLDGMNVSPMEHYRDGMIEKSDVPMDVALYIIQSSPSVVFTELIDNKKLTGVMVGENELDSAIFADYTSAAFALEVGEVSDVITVTSDRTYSYVLYKLEKDDDHFEDCYETIKESYVNNEIGKNLSAVSESLKESAEYTDAYSNISHKDISMN